MLKRTLCWGQTPRLCLMVLSSVRMSRPRMKAVPEVGGKRPVRMDLQAEDTETRQPDLRAACWTLCTYMVVVFPAPLCPRKDVICPS